MKSDEVTKYIEKILSDDSKLKKDYVEVENYNIVSKGRFSGLPEFDSFQLRTLGLGPMMSYHFASLKNQPYCMLNFLKGYI